MQVAEVAGHGAGSMYEHSRLPKRWKRVRFRAHGGDKVDRCPWCGEPPQREFPIVRRGRPDDAVSCQAARLVNWIGTLTCRRVVVAPATGLYPAGIVGVFQYGRQDGSDERAAVSGAACRCQSSQLQEGRPSAGFPPTPGSSSSFQVMGEVKHRMRVRCPTDQFGDRRQLV